MIIYNMSQDLLARAEKDHNFKKEVLKNQQKYKAFQQAAQHSQTPDVPYDILGRIKNKENTNVYFYFGYKQPVLKKNMQQVAIYLAKYFQPENKKPYKFVFFNDKSPDNYVLWNFRETFSLLKLDQIAYLEQFIVVKPFFYHKTMDWMTFGVIPKFIKSRTKFIYSYADLCDYIKINDQDLARNVPTFLFKDELPNLISIGPRLSQLRMNVEGHQRSQQEKNIILQFQKSIKSMIMKPGYEINNIEDYQIGAEGIPNILKMLVFYFDTHELGLEEEGLFRKSVSIDEENQTIMQIMSKNYDYLLEVKNPHTIANLIKRFFTSLKIPIFPYDRFQKLMSDQGVADKVKYMKEIVNTLPEINKLTLIFIFNFFREKVLKKEQFNKMSAQNIAICFAPCIFRSEKPSAADLVYASKGVIYCKLALTQFDTIFGSQQERQKLFRHSYLESKKNFEEQSLNIKLQSQVEETHEESQQQAEKQKGTDIQQTDEPQQETNEHENENKLQKTQQKTKETLNQSDIQFNNLLNAQNLPLNTRHSRQISQEQSKKVEQECFNDLTEEIQLKEENEGNEEKEQKLENQNEV